MKTVEKNKGIRAILRRKKSIFIAVCSFIVSLCILSSCILSIALIAAVRSNRVLPIVTSTVESIEQKLIDPDKVSIEVQKQTSEMIIEMLQPATEKDGMSYEELTKRITTLQQEFETKQRASSTTYGIELRISEEGKSSEMSMSVSGVGTYDEEHGRTYNDMNLSLNIYGIEGKGTIELITEGNQNDAKYYVKVKSFPLLDLYSDSSDFDIKNKWILIDSKELQNYLEAENENNKNPNDLTIKLSKEELAKIQEILESDALRGSTRWEEPETFDGKRARCFTTSWTNENVSDIVKMLEESELITDKKSMKDIKDIKSSFENLSVYMCTDRVNGNVYKSTVFAKFTVDETLFPSNGNDSTTGETVIELKVDIENSGYGKQKTVDIPEKTTNILDIIEYYEQQMEDIYNDTNLYYDPYYDDSYNSQTTSNIFYSVFLDGSSESIEISNYISLYRYDIPGEVYTYRIDQSDYAKQSHDEICNENSYACIIPTLEIMSLDSIYSGEENIMYVVGSKNIISYFDSMIEK